MTPEASWDLLRTFASVARHGSLTAAARALGVSQSTVSRHLGQLERDAGSPLLVRESPVRLTARGASLLTAIEPMVEAAQVALARLTSDPGLRGQVTVSAIGEVVRWVLAPRLGSFARAYPNLRLRLLASNQVSHLAAGEADVALRMVRPARGALVVRRLTSIVSAFHAAPSLDLGPDVPWLGLTGSLARTQEQRLAERAFAPRPPRLLVEDVEALGLAVRDGLGVAILPGPFSARLGGLVEVRPEQIGARPVGAIPPRSVWLVVHRSKQSLPEVRAVVRWLEEAFDRAPSAAP